MLSAIKLGPTDVLNLSVYWRDWGGSNRTRRRAKKGRDFSPALRRVGQLLGHVSDVRRDIPGIAERVLHARAAIAVGLVGWFRDRSCASRQRLPVHGIAIRHIHIKHR